MNHPQPRAVGIIGPRDWSQALAEVAAARAAGRAVLTHALRADARTPDTAPPPGAPPPGVEEEGSLDALVRRCHLIVFACSASDARHLVRELAADLDGSQVLIHAVRGVEPRQHKLVSEIIREECCVRKIGALVGPARAEDLRAEHPNAAVIASRFPEVIAAARAAFTHPTLRVYSNHDLRGVEVAAAASSVLAVALGMSLELGLGPATLSLLITRIVAEIARLCVARGGQERTAFGLAGLGELLVQRESDSEQLRVGRRLAAGQPAAQLLSELGAHHLLDAARALHESAEHEGVEANITQAVLALLAGRLTPHDAIQRLMTLQQMEE